MGRSVACFSLFHEDRIAETAEAKSRMTRRIPPQRPFAPQEGTGDAQFAEM